MVGFSIRQLAALLAAVTFCGTVDLFAQNPTT